MSNKLYQNDNNETESTSEASTSMDSPSIENHSEQPPKTSYFANLLNTLDANGFSPALTLMILGVAIIVIGGTLKAVISPNSLLGVFLLVSGIIIGLPILVYGMWLSAQNMPSLE